MLYTLLFVRHFSFFFVDKKREKERIMKHGEKLRELVNSNVMIISGS